MTDDEWATLLGAAAEIQTWFPDGVVFIGGIAVYAHAKENAEVASLAEKSHDADFMILRPDFADLRDLEALTSNRRLGKQQFVKRGFEFDVYVEGQSDLPVPVTEAVAESLVRSGLKVACPEHLLVMKAKAMQDRKGTPKGDKDEDDVIRILLVAQDVQADRLTHLTEEMLAELERAVAAQAPLRLARGNAHRASTIRKQALSRLAAVKFGFEANYGTSRP
jgi:hypothetical protein